MSDYKDSTDQSNYYFASDSQSEPRRPFRIADSCPRCSEPLAILVEQSEGCNWIGCSSCSFREPVDRRSVRLIERCLFLQRELVKRDPTAPLWEPRPKTDPEPTHAVQRELGT